MFQHPTVSRRDGYRKMRKTVEKVGRAIEGVDDPLPVVVALPPAFLGQDRVIRVSAADDIDDLLFSAVVHLGNEVIGAFFRHNHVARTVYVAQDDVPAGSCRPGGDVDHGMHVGCSARPKARHHIRTDGRGAGIMLPCRSHCWTKCVSCW